MLVSRISPAPRRCALARPRDGVAARSAFARRRDRPPSPHPSARALASIASTTHWDPNRDRELVDRRRVRCSAAELIEILSAPASSTAWASATERMPPPTVNGMNTSSAVRRAKLDDGVAPIGGRGDVEQHELIGAGGVVASGEFDRVPGVTEIDERDALDDPAAIDVEARDHALVVHQAASVASSACASSRRTVARRGPCRRSRRVRLTCRSSIECGRGAPAIRSHRNTRTSLARRRRPRARRRCRVRSASRHDRCSSRRIGARRALRGARPPR